MPTAEFAASLYLDLMQRSLTNLIYAEHESVDFHPWHPVKRLIYERCLKPLLDRGGARVVVPYEFDERKRAVGGDWPTMGHTMIGLRRLENLRACVEHVLACGIPGDLIETGVWRGGATIFMRAILKAHGVTDRIVWVADSFEGLPKPDQARYPQDAGDRHHTFRELAVSLEQVRRNFEKYGLLDDQVRFLKGWFRDTLPAAPIERLAVARLDGDMYESTMDALASLYDKLSVGGFLIVDDYALAGCRAAVHDFRAQRGIADPIEPIDHMGAFWQKAR
jgi:O-methyltransferase